MSSFSSFRKTAYVVLGMHRSGTSSVAGSLAGLGARPPSTLMEPKPDNPLGFWESDRVMNLNDEILSTAGSNWQDWRPLNQSVFQGPLAEHFATTSRWILDAEFGDAQTIVLKDPRICRFYPFWRRALQASDFEPVVILPVRAPDKVARSLNRRNEVAISLGLRLWLRHVLDAEHTSRDDVRHMATLDMFISQWPERFANLASNSGVDLALSDPEAISRVNQFWVREIEDICAPSDEIELPKLVDRTWTAFQAMSENGDTPASRNVLDQLRAEFDALSVLFHDPAQPY